MTVRRISYTDIEAVLQLAVDFNEEQAMKLNLDKDRMRKFLSAAIVGQNFCSVLEIGGVVVGFLAGFCAPGSFFTDTCAIELGWYVKPGHRNTREAVKLIRTFENWAVKQGADYVVLTSLEESTDVTTVYKHFGYQPKETNHFKKVS